MSKNISTFSFHSIIQRSLLFAISILCVNENGFPQANTSPTSQLKIKICSGDLWNVSIFADDTVEICLGTGTARGGRVNVPSGVVRFAEMRQVVMKSMDTGFQLNSDFGRPRCPLVVTISDGGAVDERGRFNPTVVAKGLIIDGSIWNDLVAKLAPSAMVTPPGNRNQFDALASEYQLLISSNDLTPDLKMARPVPGTGPKSAHTPDLPKRESVKNVGITEPPQSKGSPKNDPSSPDPAFRPGAVITGAGVILVLVAWVVWKWVCRKPHG